MVCHVLCAVVCTLQAHRTDLGPCCPSPRQYKYPRRQNRLFTLLSGRSTLQNPIVSNDYVVSNIVRWIVCVCEK